MIWINFRITAPTISILGLPALRSLFLISIKIGLYLIATNAGIKNDFLTLGGIGVYHRILHGSEGKAPLLK